MTGPSAGQALQGLKGGDLPLEVDAEDGIEWRRGEQLYIARGNARAVRGDLTVYADVLTAHYEPLPGGGSEVDRVDAEGRVRIVSPTATAYGDRGVYDVANGILVLVGNDLRLVNDDDVVTARDSLEYWEQKQLAVARGDARATRRGQRVRADVLSAYFEPDKNGDLEMTRVDGFGNFQVATPKGFARGERGVYFVRKEFATLTGSVKVTKEENQLNGEYAEVDMKTGVSRIFANPPGVESTGRVHGLIVPRRKPDPGS